jgi:hypothetical protein
MSHVPFALSPQWKNPSNAANAFGVTATMTLLNPLLGALFLTLLIAGGASFRPRPPQPQDDRPLPPEPEPIDDADKKRVTVALKAAGP